jgi:hypothetical protein
MDSNDHLESVEIHILKGFRMQCLKSLQMRAYDVSFTEIQNLDVSLGLFC